MKELQSTWPDLPRLFLSLWFGRPWTQRILHRLHWNKLGWIFPQSTNLLSERHWSSIPNGWGHKWRPICYIICLILIGINISDLLDHRHEILQSFLNVSASWFKDWELDLNPARSEHIPIGNSPHSVTYALPSHNFPTSRQSQKFPPIKSWELSKALCSMLKIMPSALSIKPVGCCFIWNDPSRPLHPAFSPLCKGFILPKFEYAIQATHPILSRDAHALK